MAPDIAGLAVGAAVILDAACLDAPADSVPTPAARTAGAPAAIAALTIPVQRRAFMPSVVTRRTPSGSNYIADANGHTDYVGGSFAYVIL